jgi:PDZ domain-containing protein
MISNRKRRGFIFLVISAVLASIILVSPMPYAIEMPGPSWNTLGVSTITNPDGTKKKIPLITVTGGPTYPTTGSLDLLTISLAGTPAQHPVLGDVIASWFNPQRAVIPMDSVFPPNISQSEREKENTVDMVNSQQDAIAAAFTHLGYEVTQLKIDKILSGSPAEGKLQAGDIITSVNGVHVVSVPQMREVLQKNGVDKPASFVGTRAGKSFTTTVTPVLSEKDAAGKQIVVIKVLGSSTYHFPFDVKIRLDDVGGPSAGLMFSLGVLDTITPENMTGGRKIAGTGTIDASGLVGPIGGIRQKMYSAVNASADYMFVPADNCSEAFGHVPTGLRIFKVSTLDDAVAALKVIAKPDSDSGRTAELAKLPTCTK